VQWCDPLSPLGTHNERILYIRHPSSRTLLYIIKRIYDNNNYNCYQWVKSKYVWYGYFCLSSIPYHMSFLFPPLPPQYYGVFESAHSFPTSPDSFGTLAKHCAHSPTATTTSFRTWLISMGFRFGMESRRRTVSCRTHGPK